MSDLQEREIAKYCDIRRQRLELERQARALQKQEDQQLKGIEAKFRSLLENGSRRRVAVTRGRFTVALDSKRTAVSWKTELMERIGVDAVTRIQNSTPLKEVVVITELEPVPEHAETE